MTIKEQPFKAVKITDRVYWVGAIDWTLRDFHGYATQRGSTYNAYLVLADKITLMDTVKKPYRDEMLSRIASVIDPSKIDYIVSHHAEMDHSGCLPEIIDIVRPEKVFASAMGVKALAQQFHHDKNIVAVKDGEQLSLGAMHLTFIETRMLHWPDSMMSYLAEEEMLISQDGFGMHLATTDLFTDQHDQSVIWWEAAKYYANILLPFSPLVLTLAERLGKLNLPVKYIATDHGPIWRGDGVGQVVAKYVEWATQKPTAKALVVFDTMWESTALMARAIAGGLAEAGATPRVLPLNGAHRSDVATEILDAGALIAGSSTMNNNVFPSLADVMTYLKGLKPRNLLGAAFGSYGWSGEAVGHLQTMLTEMKVAIAAEPVKVQYVPTRDDLMKCRALGMQVGEALGKAAKG
ncbi:FprA family A-type flavoprotein [bacterium]|nr:FprA family A-type flavoprotein [bacterium]